MKSLEELINKYAFSSQSIAIANIVDRQEPQVVHLEGLTGSASAFLVAGLFQKNKKDIIFIATDKESAAYMENDLSAIMPSVRIGFFPDSFKRPLNFEKLNAVNSQQRTETINRIDLSGTESNIIVTYPAAIIEPVVPPADIHKARILIEKEGLIDQTDLIQKLSNYGFSREDFVYEPGQFAIRGGIIDIFSFGNDAPYRIELFDDEVESIRTFDPISQLSQKKLRKVSIIPNISTTINTSNKKSLIEIFPPSSIILVENIEIVKDRIEHVFEKAFTFQENLDFLEEEAIKQIFEGANFITPDNLVAQIENHHILLSDTTLPPFIEKNKIERVSFNTSNQLSINRKFEILIKNLQKLEQQGFKTYLFSSSKLQIERFYSIFEDLKAEVSFQPIDQAISKGFVDHNNKIACYTDHQIFGKFHRPKVKKGFSKDKALSLKMFKELSPGDFIVHIDHGIGRFSGLEKLKVGDKTQESIRLVYKNNDLLYLSINSLHKISKYKSKEATPPVLSKLGGEAWANLKRKTKNKMKDIASELISLYAQRKASKGHAFPPDGYLQTELEASFIYEDTPDQFKATNSVKTDMMKEFPMDRLICGDVGFGKTEVAIRAAFKAVVDGKQVAILVPTTILALQHYNTFHKRLNEFGVTVNYVNRFKTTKEKNQIYKDLATGKIDIIIGTHAILNKKIKFKDLGLLVIDEEQKFGVKAKERLRNLKVNVDTLTLTATPIPRTLQFSLMAARDLSIIKTPPPNRQPIHTELRIFNADLIKEAIDYEIARGGQIFFVHNRVKTLPEVTDLIRRLSPDIQIAMAHGQMESKQLEQVLLDFINKKYDVLVSTNIIETGLDIPNANTMIINNAHQFGMSDLHQLRGRIGRSNKKAFCYLFTPPFSSLTNVARKRLKTIEEYSDLGSGFEIAMKDLDIRGAGNLLGGEQSGFIANIGYETYQKILNQAVQELKRTKFKKLFEQDPTTAQEAVNYVSEVTIETEDDLLIPDTYVENPTERLKLYTEIDNINNETELVDFVKGLKDRFGKIPKQSHNLFFTLRLRWIAKELGMERISLKNQKLRCYFISEPQSNFFNSPIFNRIFEWVNNNGKSKSVSLKQTNRNLILIKEKVKSVREARVILQQIRAYAYQDDVVSTPN